MGCQIMSEEYIVKIHDVTTGDIIERPMTDDEIRIRKADEKKAENERKAREEAAAKRQALLDKLGITEQEAAVLLG